MKKSKLAIVTFIFSIVPIVLPLLILLVGLILGIIWRNRGDFELLFYSSVAVLFVLHLFKFLWLILAIIILAIVLGVIAVIRINRYNLGGKRLAIASIVINIIYLLIVIVMILIFGLHSTDSGIHIFTGGLA